MQVLFCETTSDISFLVSKKEVICNRRTPELTPVLEAQCKEFVFHLMGTQSDKYIQVREPKGDYRHYWVTISDSAWQDLERNGKCGTRYGNSSKVSICVDDEQ